MKRTIALVSLGCSKNLVDSEVMLNILSNNDFEVINNEINAEVIIVNTCGFIESAKEESITSIIEMGQYKQKGKCKVLIVSGCLAERYREQLLDEIPEVDAVVGTGDYKDILEILEEAYKGEKVIRYGNQEAVNIDELPRIISTMGTYAYLKIAEGCDNKCTYCIIPSLRGRYRSRKFESIIEEAKHLANNGIKEIIVIAQDTTRYGIDIYNKYMLPELLKTLAKIEGIEWIRVLYAYPDNFTDDLIEVMANEEKICKYIDIPIQHASDSILKSMARRSKKKDIISLIKKLRAKMPNIVIRTSIIVGFPGETQGDYDELVEFVKEIKFDRLGAFMYSREEDTPAYKMENQVTEEVKLFRQENIMSIQQKISLEKNLDTVGKILQVLVESKEGNQYIGRSYKDTPEIDGYIYIKSKNPMLLGNFYDVLITGASEYDLQGENKDEHS